MAGFMRIVVQIDTETVLKFRAKAQKDKKTQVAVIKSLIDQYLETKGE